MMFCKPHNIKENNQNSWEKNKISDFPNFERNIELLKLVWSLRNFSPAVQMLLKLAGS